MENNRQRQMYVLVGLSIARGCAGGKPRATQNLLCVIGDVKVWGSIVIVALSRNKLPGDSLAGEIFGVI